jgi:hypothetical protein
MYEKKIYRKKPSNTTKIIYYLLHNTIICYTMQLVSTQQWSHHQAKTKNWGHEMYMEVPNGTPFGLHWSLYYLYIYISVSNEKRTCL